MSGVLIALVSLFYVGVLFAVAWYGDRNSHILSRRWQPWIYSLSLAVYCTSWTFFGAVGQAALEPWSFSANLCGADSGLHPVTTFADPNDFDQQATEHHVHC